MSLFEVAKSVLQRDDGPQTVVIACEIAEVRPDNQPNSLKVSFLDFDNLVVSFGLPFPFRCEAIVAQRHAWGGSGPRGADSRCLEHVSARPAWAAMPHDPLGASLGKSKFSVSKIW